MSIMDRPYAGTWRLNPNMVIRHTPDCLVYFNGRLEIPGCPTCSGNIDVQRFITSVTVDPSTQPIASASVTLQVPRTSAHAFIRDGQFIFQPGIEIHIYMRGYFPVRGLFVGEQEDVDISNTSMYPYYHVFHGVVVEASHDYSGGEHTASLTCSDMLHFWQYQLQSAKGAVFGERPEGSGVEPNLTSHKFMAMTPYAILYTLYRDTLGAAGGVGFALDGQTNVEAGGNVDMYSMMALYWEKRFSQHFNNLRMYGMDGTLYNAFQQAFLGRLTTEDSNKLAFKFADPNLKGEELNPLSGVEAAARWTGYSPASPYAGAASEENARKGGLGVNINEMQGFVTDLSQLGTPNLFETDYQTKLEIVSTLCEVTGFEFYQDVDGDFVFKPPYYNLDTSSSRVYVIEDIDIISFSSAHGEPEATIVKATASAFQNWAGTGTEGEFGKRAVYVDYRLVAQYGWREQSFETAYAPDSRAMYFACMNRLDLYNIGVHRASLQIPIRPELRPGYPVYIRYIDCFYYVQSISHSFSFGGQCTSTLNLIAKRGKFHAPGLSPKDGSPPTVKDIRLSDPWLPPLPLEVLGSDGVPRYQGFPNVVLGLDPDMLNPGLFSTGSSLSNLTDEGQMDALVQRALSYGVLEIDPETTASEKEQRKTGPFLLRKSPTETIKIPTTQKLLEQAGTYNQALQTQTTSERVTADTTTLQQEQAAAVTGVTELQQVVDAVRKATGTAVEDGDELIQYFNMLADLKARFIPGGGVQGHYRYYSASHPDPEQQGMKNLPETTSISMAQSMALFGKPVSELSALQLAALELSGRNTSQEGGLVYLEAPTRTGGFVEVAGKNYFKPDAVEVKAGLPLLRPNTSSALEIKPVATATHQIGAVAIAQHRKSVAIQVPRKTGQRPAAPPRAPNLSTGMTRLLADAGSEYGTIQERFKEQYNSILATYARMGTTPPQGTSVLPTFEAALATIKGGKLEPDAYMQQYFPDAESGIQTISSGLASVLQSYVSTDIASRYVRAANLWGVKDNPASQGTEGLSQAEKASKYLVFDNAVAQLQSQLALSPTDRGSVPATGTDAQDTTVYTQRVNPDATTHHPVFPVSDARGYEVIGAYRYGRGLTIEKGGNFERLTQTSPFANLDPEAVELFVQGLEKGSPSIAVGDLAAWNPEVAAQIITATGLSSDDVLIDSEGGTTEKGNQFNNAFRNFIQTSQDYCSKADVVNAPYTLAELGSTTGTICSCRGADADVLLWAFGEESFISPDQPDEVTSWLADRMLEAGQPWSTSQSALRGQTTDPAFTASADAFKSRS